jgi:hypothetical protein
VRAQGVLGRSSAELEGSQMSEDVMIYDHGRRACTEGVWLERCWNAIEIAVITCIFCLDAASKWLDSLN